MIYTSAIGMEFWYEFDNLFLWNPTPAANDALSRGFDFGGGGPDFDYPVDLLRASFPTPTHPADFISGLSRNRPGLIDVGELQSNLIGRYLPGRDDIQAAFEDFAQGVLFDDRRVDGWKVHKMDGNPENWVGYHRWNAFARIMQLFGHRPDDWLHLNRCIGLAWAIQTEARPQDDLANNLPLSSARLSVLREVWMSMKVATLDWAFTSHRFSAPPPEEIVARTASTVALTGFARIQQILQNATPTGNPAHGGSGRFWLKPYTTFIGLSIYGHKLIADPGPNRGANSAIVKVLRGTLPGIPRMPRTPLPPVPDPEIQFISDWIDSGAPEA